MRNPRLVEILANLTPERVATLVRTLAEEQPPSARGDVAVARLVERVLQGVEWGGPAEAWAAQLAVKAALAEAVARIPGMEYIEGDS